MIANYSKFDAFMDRMNLCYLTTNKMSNSNLCITKMVDFFIHTNTDKPVLFIIRGTLQAKMCKQSSLQQYNITKIILWVSTVVICQHGSNRFVQIDHIAITLMIIDVFNIIWIDKLDANDNCDTFDMIVKSLYFIQLTIKLII